MKKFVFLEYTFLFDPSEAYQHLFQFENDLAKFFSEKGLEAKALPMVEGGQSRRMMYICKKEEALPSVNQPAPVGRPKGLKRIINDLRVKQPTTAERHFKQGRLVKTKGYLKRETHG